MTATTKLQKEQQKRIFDKVWESVEGIMSDMKDKLDAALKDSSKSVEEHERILEYARRLHRLLLDDDGVSC